MNACLVMKNHPTCDWIFSAGPNFNPIALRRCSSVSNGKVSPSIAWSLNTLLNIKDVNFVWMSFFKKSCFTYRFSALEETLGLLEDDTKIVTFLIFSYSLFCAPMACCLCCLTTLGVHCNSLYESEKYESVSDSVVSDSLWPHGL